MANSGDLIELLGRLQVPERPTSLAFEMNNPFATLASVGPAYAQRGANLNNQGMMQAVRDRIAGMIPDQRAHELEQELTSRIDPTQEQSQALFADMAGLDPGIGRAEVDAGLANTEAQTMNRLAGAASNLADTPFYMEPIATLIRRMGLPPGDAREHPAIAQSRAGQPVVYTDQLREESIGRDPDTDRPTKRTKTSTAKGKGERVSAIPPADVEIDNTVRNQTSGNLSGSYPSATGENIIIQDNGGDTVTFQRGNTVGEVPRAKVIEALRSQSNAQNP